MRSSKNTACSRVAITGVIAALVACADPASPSDPAGTTATDPSGSPTGASASTATPIDTTTITTTTATTGDPGATDGTSAAATTGTGPGADTTAGDESGVITECPYAPVDGDPVVGLEVVATGFDLPLFVASDPSAPQRLFVAEKKGKVKRLEPGDTVAPVDDVLSLDVVSNAERGLLGLALHPDFPDDPRLYVSFSAPPDGHTRIEEYTLRGGVADPASARLVIELHQPDIDRNGGGIAFDPSGDLVIGLGDGGTPATARVTDTLLAKFLRIGVEPDGIPDEPLACAGCPGFGPFDYTIPADNPFVGDPAFAPETLAWGLRNPWRWAIDVETGLIWVGDVGEDSWEDVSLVEPGRDYGWDDAESAHCVVAECEAAGPHQVDAFGHTFPIAEVAQDGADCAVIAGGVYRSCEVPAWNGRFFFSDYCSGRVRAAAFDGADAQSFGVVLEDPGLRVMGNGWNAWGDVFFTSDLVDGVIYRVAPAR